MLFFVVSRLRCSRLSYIGVVHSICASAGPFLITRRLWRGAGHIPGARNVPLLGNDERAEVGTMFKQCGEGEATQRGMALVCDGLPRFFSLADELAQACDPTSPVSRFSLIPSTDTISVSRYQNVRFLYAKCTDVLACF